MTTVVSIDFGATSIRTCRVDLETSVVDVVHRFPHRPVNAPDGSLRWNWERLIDETIEGLELALERGPVASIGVDTWAVDYGLLDADGKLLSAPHAYRSDRTKRYKDVVERVGQRRLYEICGLQLQPFNTIFQLAAHDPAELEAAHSLLFLPDLVVHHLTGEVGTERTSAGSSGLYDLTARDWSEELIAASGAPRRLFTDIVDAPAPAGSWRGIPVVRVGGHDSASAVVGVSDGTAFVSSGTWLIVGTVRAQPDLSPEAQAQNFSNELGALGGIRFLKNVAGYWMVNECARTWAADPQELLASAAEVEADAGVFDATDARLLAPEDMPETVRALSGLAPDASHPLIVRTIVESMAATTSSVIAALGDIDDIVVVGGGANDGLFIERLAERSGLSVASGPTEAAALGNAVVQGIIA